MKIVIFGDTGATGQCLVEQALAQMKEEYEDKESLITCSLEYARR